MGANKGDFLLGMVGAIDGGLWGFNEVFHSPRHGPIRNNGSK